MTLPKTPPSYIEGMLCTGSGARTRTRLLGLGIQASIASKAIAFTVFAIPALSGLPLEDVCRQSWRLRGASCLRTGEATVQSASSSVPTLFSSFPPFPLEPSSDASALVLLCFCAFTLGYHSARPKVPFGKRVNVWVFFASEIERLRRACLPFTGSVSTRRMDLFFAF